MSVAVILDNQETILPIVEGSILRIYNPLTEEKEDFPNPAIGLVDGRRAAVLRFVAEKGVKTIVTPPHSFCEIAYETARKDEVNFIKVEANTTFETLQQLFAQNKIETQAVLPKEEILPSK